MPLHYCGEVLSHCFFKYRVGALNMLIIDIVIQYSAYKNVEINLSLMRQYHHTA